MAQQELLIFVGNSEPATDEEPLYFVMWHQLAEQSDNLEPELVEILKMPMIIEAYCSTYGAINRHNKHRQDDIEIDRKLRKKDSWKRVNTSIFGMILGTDSIPKCPLRSHSLVCIENHLFIVGIGPILNKELKFNYRSDCSYFTFFYS